MSVEQPAANNPEKYPFEHHDLSAYLEEITRCIGKEHISDQPDTMKVDWSDDNYNHYNILVIGAHSQNASYQISTSCKDPEDGIGTIVFKSGKLISLDNTDKRAVTKHDPTFIESKLLSWLKKSGIDTPIHLTEAEREAYVAIVVRYVFESQHMSFDEKISQLLKSKLSDVNFDGEIDAFMDMQILADGNYEDHGLARLEVEEFYSENIMTNVVGKPPEDDEIRKPHTP